MNTHNKNYIIDNFAIQDVLLAKVDLETKSRSDLEELHARIADLQNLNNELEIRDRESRTKLEQQSHQQQEDIVNKYLYHIVFISIQYFHCEHRSL